tara:strand:- start:136 stop:459 length:324 start_codon:yes stop_codon:yes gene_type:complete
MENKVKGVVVRDKTRAFNIGKKMILAIQNNGAIPKCGNCGVVLPLKDGIGCHTDPWAHGNDTELKNGWYGCKPCNDNQGKMKLCGWKKSEKYKKFMIKRNKEVENDK